MLWRNHTTARATGADSEVQDDVNGKSGVERENGKSLGSVNESSGVRCQGLGSMM